MLVTNSILPSANTNYVKSNIITQESINTLDIKSFVNVPIEEENEESIVTEFPLAQNTMAIFTTGNNQGWNLNSGDTFSISISISSNLADNKELFWE